MKGLGGFGWAAMTKRAQTTRLVRRLGYRGVLGWAAMANAGPNDARCSFGPKVSLFFYSSCFLCTNLFI
jgi:hypothetical protein